jgi:transmembrane sensor
MDEAVQKVAAQWFVKLRSPDVTSADRHLHREWLISKQAHQLAYDNVCKQWSNLDGLEDWARSELGQLNLETNARVRYRTIRWGAVLATAALIVLGFFLVPFFDKESRHYQTVKSEQRLVTLEDGSRMHLNTASAVAVSFEADLREITLSKGEGVFDVEHDSLRPFVVHAGVSSIIALGTRFSVHYKDFDSIEVTVLEGRVAIVPIKIQPSSVIEGFENVDQIESIPKSLILGMDQQVIVGAGGDVEPIRVVNAANEMAWLEGKLVFNGTPLREVAGELSRYIPGQIRVANGVPNHPVTGIIQIRSTETMLDLLSQVVPVTPVKQSASVTVLHATSAHSPGG